MPLRHRLILLLFLALAALTVAAQERAPDRPSIADLYSAGNIPDLIASLLLIHKNEPAAFEINGYSYLAGRAEEDSGDPASAAGWYLKTSAERSPLKAYGLWRLSRIFRRTGNLPAERLFLLEASTLESDSAAAVTASERNFRSNFESGNDREVIRLSGSGPYQKVISGTAVSAGAPPLSDGTSIERDLLPVAGRALFLAGQPRAARLLFERAIATANDPRKPDDIALEAAEGLDAIDFTGTVEREGLDAETHYQRAEIYQFNRRFRAARVHYRAIFEKHRESARAPEALFQIGTGYARDRDFHNAIEWFERLQGEFPYSPVSVEALYQTAGAYASVNKPKESAARYEKFLDEHPGSDRAAGAYLNLIDLYRDAGEAGEALKWTERMRVAYPAGDEAAKALFARTLVHMSQNDWEDALADIETLLAGDLPDIPFAEETMFLRGFVLEMLGRPYPAADAYAQVSDGLGSYYGWRATERLKSLRMDAAGKNSIPGQYLGYLNLARVKMDDTNAREIKFAASAALRLADSDSDRREMKRILATAYERLPEYEVDAPQPVRDPVRQTPLKAAVPDSKAGHSAFAEALLFLGIFDEGAAELEIAMRQEARAKGSDGPSSADERLLSYYYRRGGLFSRSVGEAESRWRTAPDDYPLEMMPPEELQILYPAAYKDIVLRYAEREGIDPRFLLAVMRQESRFDPAVKSAAAARGLMQFITSTASKTAEEAGLSGFVREDLYDPATSVLLGSRYLANLFREFPDEHAAVAASYNAGEDSMLRWYRRSRSTDPDRYVPEIRYPQTKDYVRKVMGNYRAYRFIYDVRLNPVAAEPGHNPGW